MLYLDMEGVITEVGKGSKRFQFLLFSAIKYFPRNFSSKEFNKGYCLIHNG